jgi:hypothetical protein
MVSLIYIYIYIYIFSLIKNDNGQPTMITFPRRYYGNTYLLKIAQNGLDDGNRRCSLKIN